MIAAFDKFGEKLKAGSKKTYIYIGAALGLVALFWLYFKSRTTSDTTTDTSTGETPAPDNSGAAMAAQNSAAIADLANQTNEALTGLSESYDEKLQALSEQQAAATEQQTQAFTSSLLGVTDSLTESLQGLSDQFNTQYQNLSETVTGYQEKNTDALTDLMDYIDTQNSKQDKTITKQISDTQKSQKDEDDYDSQVDAAKEIKNLSDLWFSTRDTLTKDGNLSAADQSRLDEIHLAAEKVGIDAGFGSGGTTGSDRNIPSDVAKAAGK